MDGKLWWLDRAVFAAALVALVIGAASGPSFGAAASPAILAAQLDHSATAPLYDALAGAAAALPIGEPALRVGLLGAVLGAVLLLGVMRAARTVLPRDPLAGLVAAALLFVAPPFREAAAFGGAGLLAACGCVWALAYAIEAAKLRSEATKASATAAAANSGAANSGAVKASAANSGVANSGAAKASAANSSAAKASAANSNAANSNAAKTSVAKASAANSSAAKSSAVKSTAMKSRAAKSKKGAAKTARAADTANLGAERSAETATATSTAESLSAPARASADRSAAAALACGAIVLGSTPWLGVATLLAITAWVRPSRVVVPALAATAVLAVVVWLGAIGSLPAVAPDLAAAIGASGRGAAAIVVGAGLLGTAFGAITALPRARWVGALAVLAALHALLAAPHDALPLLALLAVGAAVLPSAIVRAAGAPADGPRRHLIALGAGVPLLAAAALTGATLCVDDPGEDPARLANDLTRELPPGPGVLVETRGPSWVAVSYAVGVAGERPDFALAPPLPPQQADVAVANALRRGSVVGADVLAFGRLDPARAAPRGRGFELVAAPYDKAEPVLAPAAYRSEIGREQSTLLALDRARLEATAGRLDGAARAAGLANRFGAGDLAVLAATVPTTARPAFYGFVPSLDEPFGPWLLDLFGDDLAWVAGLTQPAVFAPPPRRLHALWRRLWRGEIAASDPSITALGPRAVTATNEMLATLKQSEKPPSIDKPPTDSPPTDSPSTDKSPTDKPPTDKPPAAPASPATP